MLSFMKASRKAALRQFIEVDKHKVVVSVRWLAQHRVVNELVGTKCNSADFKDAEVKDRPEERTLRVGE